MLTQLITALRFPFLVSWFGARLTLLPIPEGIKKLTIVP